MTSGDAGAGDGLVRRRRDPVPGRPRPGFPWVLATQGGDALDGQHGHPEGRRRTSSRPRLFINLYYVPANAAAIEAYVNYVCPVKGAARGHARRIDPSWRTTR